MRTGVLMQAGSVIEETEAVVVSRVLVVDDHRTFAELLSRALDAEPDLRCVGYAQNAAQARELVLALEPDLVLMDLEMPDQDGISATADLVKRHPHLKVLILTAHAGEREMARAGAAGASGFLAKDGALTDVLDALRNARRGSLILPPSVVAGFASRVSTWAPAADPGLTPRELQVLQLLGQGRDPRAISKELGVSLHTCRGYVKSILAKLDAHSQLEAVVVATRHGLISVGDRA
jgi:DNA-binding NarL/FixJ family response regulator